MRESQSFSAISEALREKKVKGKTVDSELVRQEEKEQNVEMGFSDYFLSVRGFLEKQGDTREEKELTEQAKTNREIFTPELYSQYTNLAKEIILKGKIFKKHGQRELADVEEESLAAEIEAWAEKVVTKAGEVREEMTEADREDLRQLCRMLFSSLANVVNTQSLEKDIEEKLDNDEYQRSAPEARQKKVAEMERELAVKYQVSEAEGAALIDLVVHKKDEYGPKALVDTLNGIWRQYGLGEKKKEVGQVAVGYLASKVAESFAPSLFQGLMTGDKFNLAVFLEFLGLQKFAEAVDTKTGVELGKLVRDINAKVNDRIVNSLFFQEFEFVQARSLGEVYVSLERGKKAVEDLLYKTMAEFLPSLASIGLSLGFLSKINPVMGGIGLCSLPVMYHLSRKQGEKVTQMYINQEREQERATTKIGAVQGGLEEIRTSPDSSAIASSVKGQLGEIDELSLRAQVERGVAHLKSEIPFDVASVLSAVVGVALVEAGQIPPGAVLSNYIYNSHIGRFLNNAMRLFFYEFASLVQDIKRMEEILGQYHKLDLPEGQKEKDRVGVEQLPNLDIKIKDLKFRGILKGVNLEIKQGEFVVIAGPSGQGKSTLLRNLVGLYRPDSGEVEIGGQPLEKIKKFGKDSIYSAMSYANQRPQMFPEMTLRQNLMLWAGDKADSEEVRTVLRDLHLEKFIDRLDEQVKNLSGGELVRIGVARILLKKPKIMLLDEPTASLDSQSASEVRKVIAEMRAKHPEITIVCVSHDEDLMKEGDRTVQLGELQK